MMKDFIVEKKIIPSAGKNIKILVLRPIKNARPKRNTPGLLWIHGGGYRKGMSELVYLSRALNLVRKYGAVVVAPEYRLSKEAPYPAALADCYAALKYLKEHTEELGVNSSQLMVGGESAGGGLTAALCMYARDKEEVEIAFQMPLYPMIDNEDTESSKDNHAPVWNTKKNHSAWKLYLRGLQGRKVPAYAAPAKQKDFHGLPPAYTFVGDLEPFYCETLTFIENLKKAGVEAKVDVYQGCFHAFDLWTPFRKVSKQAVREFEKQFCYAVKHYFAEQNKDN